MITKIHYKNFKALDDFTVHIKEFNILTGPNNNGKSTILDGIRVLQAALRFAYRYNPKPLKLPFGIISSWGYEIPETSLPITVANIQTNFNMDEPSLIIFKLSQGNTLTILFHPDHPIYLYFDTNNKMPKTAKEFRNEFALNISIVPTLGPFEIEEEILGDEYVKRWYGSRRSPRMFRSYWMHNPKDFEEFKELVEKTWEGTSIAYPERVEFSKQLIMFCYENRMPREICWSGFGFQIWLQLLTHVVHSKNSDLIVVDEPEIYLHPDLQHKVLEILKKLESKIILATHSVEIINSVEPSDVLLIDKKNKFAKRISDMTGLQGVSLLLGSGQNIQLTRLARGKKILFVEGKDIKLLSRFAKVCVREEMFGTGILTVIPIEGFSKHEKIIHTNWAFTQILGEELKIAVLLDRDYRTTEEVKVVLEKLEKEVALVHILSKKEIENYFIIPNAIEKAILQRIEERAKTEIEAKKYKVNITEILTRTTDFFKTDTFSQIIAHKSRTYEKIKTDLSTVLVKSTQEFEKNWSNLEFRYGVISGKAFFSFLNDYLQTVYKISITYSQIANHMRESDLNSEIKLFFSNLQAFKNSA